MKAIYNNTTNSLIAFKGDHRPIQICKGGQLIDNISAVPLITEQDTYTSEYKANLIGLELQGNDVIVNDYTKEVTNLLTNGSWSQSGVTGVKLISVPSELVGKEITYKLETPLSSGYTIGLLKGDNDSVAITTTPIVASEYDNFYITGVLDDADIPNIMAGEIVEAYEYQSPSNIDVKLSGENKLISPSTFKDYFNENNYLEYDISMQTYLVNYTNVGTSCSICHFDTPIPSGTPYTLLAEAVNYDFELNKSSGNLVLGLYKKDDSGVAWAGKTLVLNGFNTNKVIMQSNITTQPTTDVWFFNYHKTGEYVKNLKVRFMVYFGDKTITEWQPYFAPVTLNIPYILATGDKLTLKDKKVMMNNTDITSTDVGQNLLALAEATQNQTNIITATSEIPLSKKIITYAKWGGNSED